MEQLDMFSGLIQEDPEREEYLGLVKKLNYFAELYYSKDEPEISDYEYDSMNNRLKQIEKEHPDWIVPDSPSVRVGWKAEKGVLVKHNVPMLSLQDVFEKEDVYEFVNSIRSEFGDEAEFGQKRRIGAEFVDQEVFGCAGTVHVPERVADQVFHHGVVDRLFRTDDEVSHDRGLSNAKTTCRTPGANGAAPERFQRGRMKRGGTRDQARSTTISGSTFCRR